MKTNTYKEFKNWVKFTCNEKNAGEDKSYHIYNGDTAHAIYTAWYMFKHNFAEEQVNEYIQKDIEKSRKHFYNHGFCISIRPYTVTKYIPEEEQILIKLPNSKWDPYYTCEGGGWNFENDYTQKKWTEAVKAIWEYWELKKMEEIDNE